LGDFELGLRVALDAGRQRDVAANLAADLLDVFGLSTLRFGCRLFRLQLPELTRLGVGSRALLLRCFLLP